VPPENGNLLRGRVVLARLSQGMVACQMLMRAVRSILPLIDKEVSGAGPDHSDFVEAGLQCLSMLSLH
jgi:hypothetical protein